MSDTSETKAPALAEGVHILTIRLPDYDRELSYALLQEQGGGVIKPQFDYQAEEKRYVDGRYLLQMLQKNPQKQEYLDQLIPSLTQQLTNVNELRLQIETYRPRSDQGKREFQLEQEPRLHWPEEVAPLVHEALRTFGYDAIRLTLADAILVSGCGTLGPSYNSLCIELDRLGIVIGEIIRDWQSRVGEEEDLEKRSQVQKYLRDIGQSLVPSMRGKRENRVMEPAKVKLYYYRQRFACEQAKVLFEELANVTGYRNLERRLLAICATLNLPHDPHWWGFTNHEKWWGFPDHEYVYRQLLNATESAVLLTARHFAPATEQTIRNILSL